MKEKLIRLWRNKEHHIKNATELADRKTFFSQAFGALEMAMAMTDNWDEEAELIDLWNDEWKARLEGKFMKFRLIDDPLCDVNEDIPAYENCEDCPYFWDCMEEDDEDEM